jgi:ribosome recycling factor
MSKIRFDKQKIIQAINAKLQSVSIVEVARRMEKTHQTLYYHLDEARAPKANIEILNQIASTIAEIEKEHTDAAEKLLQKVTQ